MKRLSLSLGVVLCASLVALDLASAQDRIQARQQVTFEVLKVHGPDIASLSASRVTVSSQIPDSPVRPAVHTLVADGQNTDGWARFRMTLREPSPKKLIVTITD